MAFQITTVHILANSVPEVAGNGQPPRLPPPFIGGLEAFKAELKMNQTAANAMRALLRNTPLAATDIDGAKAEVLNNTESALKSLAQSANPLSLEPNASSYRNLGGQHIMGFWVKESGAYKNFTFPIDSSTGTMIFRGYVLIVVEVAEVP